MAISWRRSTGAGLVKVGLANRPHDRPPPGEQLLESIEEDVAAGLGDVEQSDAPAVDAGDPGHALAHGRRELPRRVEHGEAVVPLVHERTSTVTGSLPMAPDAHEPMMALNMPAPPPA